MDSFTHTLTAVVLGQTGLNRKTRFATLALILGSNLPDVDVIARLAGSATYLKFHRGITHSLLGATVLTAFLSAALYLLGRRAPQPKTSKAPLDGRWLFGISLISASTHLLMDFTNPYGIRPFLPFSGRWYAWDIEFIIDPVILLILTVGLAVPALFRLISEEVGARKPGYRMGAIVSLCCVVVYWGLRDFAHRRVLNMLDSHSYGRENPRRLGAFPTPTSPLAWVGVVETDSAFHVLSADALDADVNALNTRVFHKPASSPALDAATQTRTGAIFMDFARFPWARVEETDDGFYIELEDLRFISLSSRRRSFVAEVDLDKNLRARTESFSFSGSARGGE